MKRSGLLCLLAMFLLACGTTTSTRHVSNAGSAAPVPKDSYAAMSAYSPLPTNLLQQLAAEQPAGRGDEWADGMLDKARAQFALAQRGIDTEANREAGVQTVAAIVREHPKYHRMDEVLFRLGAGVVELGQMEAGLDAVRRLIADHPKSTFAPQALAVFGDFYREQGAPEDARKAYERAVRYGADAATYAYVRWRAAEVAEIDHSRKPMLEKAAQQLVFLRATDDVGQWKPLTDVLASLPPKPMVRCPGGEQATTHDEHRQVIQANRDDGCVLAHQRAIFLSLVRDEFTAFESASMSSSGGNVKSTLTEAVRLGKLVELAHAGQFSKAPEGVLVRQIGRELGSFALLVDDFARAANDPDLYAMAYYLLETYRSAFDRGPLGYQVTYRAARNAEALKKTDEAATLYRELNFNFPTGPYAEFASKRAVQIGGTATNAPRKRAQPSMRPAASEPPSRRATTWPSLQNWDSKRPGGPKDVALIVSIEDYAFLGDVPGATANANAWENYFRARGVESVQVLANQDARKEEILKFAKSAADDVGRGGTLWFVFIGHGAAATDGKDGLLVGMDAVGTYDSIQARGLKSGELIRVLESGKQSQTIAVLDACFSGRSGDGQMLAKGTQPAVSVDLMRKIRGSTVVLSAARADQVAGSLPGEDRPAFSYLLLGALRGWGDDGDSRVTTDEAIQFVRQQLRYVKGRQQTPEAYGDGSVVLSTGATEPDPGVSDLMTR